MTDKKEIEQAIFLLNLHPEAIAWQDFGDRGNSCIGRYQDGFEESINLGTVKVLIPKNSTLHISLNRSISQAMNLNWISYDWLLKAISRLLAGSSLANFSSMLQLSIEVKKRMKERGLTEINSLSEVL